MSRPLRPADRPPSRFPRLGAAWRMLAAPLALVPTIAHADATVPPPKTPPATPPIKRAPGVKPAPKPPAERPPPPPLEGEYMRVEPPSREQISILLHPHAPGEPCRKVIG